MAEQHKVEIKRHIDLESASGRVRRYDAGQHIVSENTANDLVEAGAKRLEPEGYEVTTAVPGIDTITEAAPVAMPSPQPPTQTTAPTQNKNTGKGNAASKE